MYEEKYIDARGIYNPYGRPIHVRKPADLVSAGISLSHGAIQATWGDKGLSEYLREIETREGTEKTSTSNQWASSDFQKFGDEDPRSVKARAAMADRQSPLGHLETVTRRTIVPVEMTAGESYIV